MVYQQILEMEEEFNQKIADLVISMSDTVVYVVDVKQFATSAQLTKVIEEAKELIDRTVKFFNKYKERGSLGEYSPIDLVRWLAYLKSQFSKGVLRFSGKGAGRARKTPDRI